MKKVNLRLLILVVIFSFGCETGAYHKGTKLAESGDYILAIPYLKEAIRNNPNNDMAYNNLGFIYGKLGRNPEAIASYQEAIRINPNNAMAHNNLGTEEEKLGHKDKAIAAYREALRLDRSMILAQNNLNRLEQNIVQENPNTQRYSASTITPRQKFNLALNYSKQGQHEKAIPLYKEIIQINPQNIDESITGDLFPIKIDAYVNLGSSYNDLNRPHEAIRYLKEAMRLNPNNWMPHFNLGLSYHLLSRFQEAITSYKKSIQIKPEDSRIHNRLGMSYDKLGEYQEAIASYKEAIRLNPKDYMALHNLGNSYFAIGHSQKAISKWKEALRINPSFTNSRLNLNQIEGKINRPRTQPPVAKAPPQSPKPSPQSGTGSGFFVSKMGHVITNAHVVQNCKKVTIGDNANKQVPAEIINTDRSNDLALLRLSTLEMASAESKSLIQKLGIVVVPLASKGLLRSEDVRLGEKVLVAGYPFGDVFSNTIKVTTGVVSATRGLGDDSGQFQLDAAVQPGNSGGPIYDSSGNIVGVVVAQLNKLKVAKAIGSLPENVNFGIKASTVRQFLISSGVPSKKSERTEEKSTEQLAVIAKNQALMVMCLQ